MRDAPAAGPAANPAPERVPRAGTLVTIALVVITVILAARRPDPHWGGLAAMGLFYAATHALGVWASRPRALVTHEPSGDEAPAR